MRLTLPRVLGLGRPDRVLRERREPVVHLREINDWADRGGGRAHRPGVADNDRAGVLGQEPRRVGPIYYGAFKAGLLVPLISGSTAEWAYLLQDLGEAVLAERIYADDIDSLHDDLPGDGEPRVAIDGPCAGGWPA